MNEYEKYRLQWMLDHDYSLPDLLERLSDIAMNENLDEIQNPRVMLNEAFERLEYEQGFDNEEIWLCKDEWEHDLYSSNEYSLTDAGKTKVKHFIEDCRIKQDSILKAGLDTAKETTLPSVEDILCNVEDMVDEDGKYTNAWNITDNYLSDPLELNKDDDFVNGKYRIYHLYTAMNVNAKDKAIFLKNEYGIGGRTYDFKNKKQDKGYIDHDSKGLTVCVSSKDSASLFKDSESKTFSWADVNSRIERLIATGKYFTDEEMEHYNSMNKDEILPAWLLEKCGLSDYTKNSQAVARPDWMEEYEILIDRDNDYVLLRDPDENVNQVWTASGKFLSTVQLENETVAEAMEEYYYNITKGGFYIPDRIKEGYMEEDYDNLSKEDIEL